MQLKGELNPTHLTSPRGRLTGPLHTVPLQNPSIWSRDGDDDNNNDNHNTIGLLPITAVVTVPSPPPGSCLMQRPQSFRKCRPERTEFNRIEWDL